MEEESRKSNEKFVTARLKRKNIIAQKRTRVRNIVPEDEEVHPVDKRRQYTPLLDVTFRVLN